MKRYYLILFGSLFIALALSTVFYGVVQTNKQARLVQCNKDIISMTNDALISRDREKVAADESSLAADAARRKIILTLFEDYRNRASSSSRIVLTLQQIDFLKNEYMEATDRRAGDLRKFIVDAKMAPLPVYTCGNGD